MSLHEGEPTVPYYGRQAPPSGLGWREAAVASYVAVMTEDAEQVRAALKAYMAAHGLKPTRWAIDSKLSESAISHFIKGRSKSMSPASLTKLADNRGLTVKGLLGFVPRYAADTTSAEAPGAPDPGMAALVRTMAEELRALREEVRGLTEEMRAARRSDPK